MDLSQYLILIFTIIGGFGFLFREIKEMEKDLRNEVKTQSARSDQLYTMFIDLLKNENK